LYQELKILISRRTNQDFSYLLFFEEFLNEKADRWADEGRVDMTMYDGMSLAYSLLFRGLREESNTGAP